MEEIDILRQKIKAVEAVASSLEAQLEEEKKKFTDLEETAQKWKHRVKEKFEQYRSQIADMRNELSLYKQVEDTSNPHASTTLSEPITSPLGKLREEYEIKALKASERIEQLTSKLEESEQKRAEGLKELERLKTAYLESDKKNTPDFTPIRGEYELERKSMEEKLKHLSELEEFKKNVESQGRNEVVYESFSKIQLDAINSLQSEINQLSERNRLLEQSIEEKDRLLAQINDKEAEWKRERIETTKNHQETIEKLEKLLEAAYGILLPIFRKSDPEDKKHKGKVKQLHSEGPIMGNERIHSELRRELEAALGERSKAIEQASEDHAEVERLRRELNKSQDSLKQIESSFLHWKEKVKAAKLRDTDKISKLETALSDAQLSIATVTKEMKNLIYHYGGAVEGITTIEEAQLGLRQLLSSVRESLASSLSHTVHAPSYSLLWMTERLVQEIKLLSDERNDLRQTTETLKREKNELLSQLHKCKEEFHDFESQLVEANKVVHEQELARLSQLNTQLEERCELLRKEVKRQRELFYRGRARQEVVSGILTNPASLKEAESALGEASGGGFEKEIISLALIQSHRDSELRTMRTKITELEKQNADLKELCERNNKGVAEYRKEIETLRSNERVQASIEYVKNIIYQFLCVSEDLRMKMIPAIATVLEFSTQEKQNIVTSNPACPKLI